MHSEIAQTAEDATAPHERLHILLTLADSLMQRDTVRGVALALEAEQLADALGDDAGRVQALYIQGRILMLRGENATGRDVLQQAVAFCEARGLDTALPQLLHILARALRTLGFFAEGYQVLTRGLALAQEQGNRGVEASLLAGLGSMYKWFGDYETAITLQLQALALARPLPNFSLLSEILNSFGGTHMVMAQSLRSEDPLLADAALGVASAAFDEVVALAEASGRTSVVVVANLNRVTIAVERGDTAYARGLLAAIDAPIAQLHAERYRGSYLVLLGQVEAREGDHRAALVLYEQARVILERLKVPTYLRGLYNAISASHEALGDAAQALAHFKQFYAYNSKIEREKVRQLAQLAMLNDQLREKVIRDPLTGLFNRRYLEEMLAQELMKAQHTALPVSVVSLDIDHFKAINDTYGHAAGDVTIQAVATLLLSHARPGDAVCRFGGEEFVAILPGLDTEAAWQWAEHQRAAFAALRITHEGTVFSSAFSVGVATAPTDGITTNTLLQSSDRALYTAKRTGRNRVKAYRGKYATVFPGSPPDAGPGK